MIQIGDSVKIKEDIEYEIKDENGLINTYRMINWFGVVKAIDGRRNIELELDLNKIENKQIKEIVNFFKNENKVCEFCVFSEDELELV